MGEEEKIGQHHPEALPEHETRAQREADDGLRETDPAEPWAEEEPAIRQGDELPPAHRPS